MRFKPETVLDSDATPFPLRSPPRFLHPPSPLARFVCDTKCTRSSRPVPPVSARPSTLNLCPPLSLWQHELHKPIDPESVTRPSTPQFASFYALVYSPPPPFELRLGDIHRIVRDLDGPDLISFEVVDEMEIDSILCSQSTPQPPARPLLPIRQADPSAAHRLSTIRMRFISKHIPRLAEALGTMFDRRTESDDRFCTWYHSLSVDERVVLHPTLQLERHLATCGPVSPDDVEDVEMDIDSLPMDYNVLSNISNHAKRTLEPDVQPSEEPPLKKPRPSSLRSSLQHESTPCPFIDSEDDMDLVRRWFQVLALRQPKVDLRKRAMIAQWKAGVKQRKIAPMYVASRLVLLIFQIH